MAHTPFKMKGSPFKRNFGLPKERNIIKEEKEKIVNIVSDDVENEDESMQNNKNN